MVHFRNGLWSFRVNDQAYIISWTLDQRPKVYNALEANSEVLEAAKNALFYQNIFLCLSLWFIPST